MLGANALIKALELIKNGKAQYIPQDELKATKAPSLKKEMGLINWNTNSRDIHNKIRGLQPWPSAYTHFNDKTIKIWESKIEAGNIDDEFEPGIITGISDHLKVKTKDGYINIYKLQPENKNIINAKDWVNGARACIGAKFY
jgi:methionyl-tRNA formyltransferase